MMKISDAGLALDKSFEGCILHLYNCPANDCTIGVGHLVHKRPICGDPSEEPFKAGITDDQATDLLREDMGYAEHAVDELVKVALRQGQFDALCLLTFNIGTGALRRSTLLRLLNEGRMDLAADQFLAWDHVAGVVSPGLLRRREAERKMFVGE